MTHIRQTVRDAAKADLATDVTLVGGAVGGLRQYARNLSSLPALEVWTPQQDSAVASQSGNFHSDLLLGVTAYAAIGEGVDDDLDAIAEQIEASVKATIAAQGGVLKRIQSELDPGDGAEKRPARLDIIFTAFFLT